MVLNREEMIEKYLHLVKYAAGRITVNLPAHLDREDLFSYGIFGLMDAVDKFDPTRGVKFETYASQRIRGAILDAIRQQSWAPRSTMDKLKKVNEAQQAFAGEEEPTEKDLAAKAGMSVDEFRSVLAEVNRLSMDSLEQFLMGDFESENRVGDFLEDEESPNPEASFLEEETKEQLTEALRNLPERDYLIISLYYHQELTLKEIGRILDISESRVSQLHSQALLKLRGELIDYAKGEQ